MPGLFSTPDMIALAWFVAAWIGYAITLEWTRTRRQALNALMDRFRDDWMDRMLERDMRMFDGQIMASLQNGTAFFASTSLIAVGGALTLIRSTDEAIGLLAAMPFGSETSRVMWEAKSIGLAVIFVYAFFKFAWSYRLFNYVAIMLGAAPPAAEKDTPQARAFAHRAAGLAREAGRHFNRGQRAFFFALGYLGWFVGPWVFVATTAAVVLVMWRRQFASNSRRAVIG